MAPGNVPTPRRRTVPAVLEYTNLHPERGAGSAVACRIRRARQTLPVAGPPNRTLLRERGPAMVMLVHQMFLPRSARAIRPDRVGPAEIRRRPARERPGIIGWRAWRRNHSTAGDSICSPVKRSPPLPPVDHRRCGELPGSLASAARHRRPTPDVMLQRAGAPRQPRPTNGPSGTGRLLQCHHVRFGTR